MSAHDRAALIAATRELFPESAERAPHVSEIRGGRAAAMAALAGIDPADYGKTRNYIDGAVTRLSPYLRHGVLSLAEVRDHALRVSTRPKAEKLVNELCWRDYWQRVYRVLGDAVWDDLEPYKTGYRAASYAEVLPEDIQQAGTESPCINRMVETLYRTGYLHNRLRMYLAAYVVHWRRVRWQTGAAWFLAHLLDGDPASNNLSWQWVASTFSSKPYIFNADNMRKFLGEFCDFAQAEPLFDAPYDELAARLFPYGQGAADGGDATVKAQLKRVQRPSAEEVPSFKRPIVWIHGDNLNPHSPALLAYPDAPRVWVWDEALLDQYAIALKRLVFLHESVVETGATLRRGHVYPELVTFAEQHGADGIITTDSPSPRFWGIVRTLRARYGVAVMREPSIVDDGVAYDLRRFSRYWRQAAPSAFG